MKVEMFESDTLESALEKGFNTLNLTEEDILYTKEEIAGGLFKKAQVRVKIIPLTEISKFIKEYLTTLLSNMDIEVSMETRIRNKQIQIKMFSDRNQILIGKQGRTLDALTIILKQAVQIQVNVSPYIILDVENYKEKQVMHLERLAKRTAKEVRETKIDATLDSMNSYERRIVHNVLTNFRNIYTTSEGEEPNRCVVIKYKEEE